MMNDEHMDSSFTVPHSSFNFMRQLIFGRAFELHDGVFRRTDWRFVVARFGGGIVVCQAIRS